MNTNITESHKQNVTINNYKAQIECLKDNCINLTSEIEFKDLFKGIIIIFIKDIICLFNKLVIKHPELKQSSSAQKIHNLNILLESLEGDGILFGFDCNDIMLRSYITYFYTKYRDPMIEWDLEAIKRINEEEITEAVITSSKEENLADKAEEHLNIIPEIVLMINKLKEKDILKIFYLLNNLNTTIDIYLLKKSQNELI
jgi:hypothetical protein